VNTTVKDVMTTHVVADPARFMVTVDNGIVTVRGIPENESVGRDMIEEIRHVEGVVAVRDFLTRVKEQRFVQRTDPDLDFWGTGPMNLASAYPGDSISAPMMAA
jgi:hypothetical protein